MKNKIIQNHLSFKKLYSILPLKMYTMQIVQTLTTNLLV